MALIGRLDAVPAILQILSDMTGLRFAAVARVTSDSWTACAVLDRLGFGLQPGGTLAVTTTLCHDVHAAEQAILIEHASQDPVYRDHATPQLYGFESYVSVPIRRRDGSFFGTICALDPRPIQLDRDRLLPILMLFAQLVASQMELEERLSASQSDLSSAKASGVLREQFIAILGHDLRNPIASVASGLRQLQRTPLTETATQMVAHMEQSCARMAELVDNTLDFARGRLGGGIPVACRPVADLAAQLRQVISECQASHPDRAIQASLDLAGPVFCDPQRIAQVVSNLLANALVHGAQDRPVLLSAQGGPGGLRLSVSNAGQPIPPEIQARLFQPFARSGAGGHGAEQQGLGLGLYIAAEVARAHGGTLRATSDAVATTFTLELPPGG